MMVMRLAAIVAFRCKQPLNEKLKNCAHVALRVQGTENIKCKNDSHQQPLSSTNVTVVTSGTARSVNVNDISDIGHL